MIIKKLICTPFVLIIGILVAPIMPYVFMAWWWEKEPLLLEWILDNTIEKMGKWVEGK